MEKRVSQKQIQRWFDEGAVINDGPKDGMRTLDTNCSRMYNWEDEHDGISEPSQ